MTLLKHKNVPFFSFDTKINNLQILSHSPCITEVCINGNIIIEQLQMTSTPENIVDNF